MPRPSYGSEAKKRTKRLLEALLAHASDDLDDSSHLPIQLHWQTELRLVVRTKIRFLEELTAKDLYPGRLSRDQIREALRLLEDFLGILQDNRAITQGAEDWHFTLTLWHRRQEVAANLQRFDQEWEQQRILRARRPVTEAASEISDVRLSQHQHWGEAIDVSLFYGRAEELAVLKQWLVQDRCRFVGIIGMGGMGKTALSVKLAQQVQQEFDVLIWRSLRNAPPVEQLLTDLIYILSRQQAQDVAGVLDHQVTQLIEYLRARRCLLVLDNVESILRSDQRAGAYREGYEGYGDLLRCIAESSHQSCLVITSREKPRELRTQEGQQLPVRSLRVVGLGQAEGREILQEKGFVVSATEGQSLVERYTGNPLALKIVATTIQELFGGSIADFLSQGSTVFGDIADLLDQQFNRLSELEKQVMFWLAINREGVCLSELKADIVPAVGQRELIEAVESLQLRCLIERQAASFTQQPVVMEYVTEQLIHQVCQECMAGELGLLDRYALIKAQAKDYLRNSQIHLLLQPVVEQLTTNLGQQGALVCLNQLLEMLRSLPQRPGYAGGNLLNLLWRLPVNLTGYDLSHLTIWQAYLQGMGLQRVNLAGADLTKSVLTQTPGDILSAAFSPDGTLLATGIDNEICLWRIADHKQLITCEGHSGGVQAIAFSPDGTLLASGSHDHTIRLWDVRAGQCLKTLRGHTHRVLSIAFSPDGTLLASGSHDHTIRLWDVAHPLDIHDRFWGRCLRVLEGHCNRVLAVKFSPTGQTLFSGGQDETVRQWDVTTGKCVQVIKTSVNWIFAFDLSSDGNCLATGSDGKGVRLWQLQTGDCRTLAYTSHVWSLSFNPTGTLLATASEDRTIKLWDTTTGELVQTLPDHTRSVWLACFSPDGQMLVSASDDRTIKLWDTQTGRCLRTLRTYNNWVLAVAFSPGQEWLVSSSEDRLIRIWQPELGECLRILSGHTDIVSAVAVLPPNPALQTHEILASASDDQTIKLWDIKTGDCLRTIRGHRDWVQSVGFSGDGRLLASGSSDRTIKVWDWQTGECLQTLEGHVQSVKSVAFNLHQPRLLASGSDDQTVKLWDLETGICTTTLQGHADWVLSVAFNPRGDLVASGSGDRTIKLWAADLGECLQTLQGHENRVRCVVFSPDGQTLASAGEDHTIKLWDSATGACLKTLAGHGQAIWSVAFRADGSALATCSEDGTIRIWDVKLGQCLQILRSDRPYEGMDITGVIGLSPTQIATLKALGAVEQE